MPGLSLVLDIVILVLLGATIFYAIRLSRHLDAFRSNRSDMERLIRELSSQITRAQEGVSALDEAAKESGDQLRALVAKGQGLTDELALMTEAGNSLATRLEGLATRNRSLVDELGQTAAHTVYPGARSSAPLAASKPSWAEPRETRDAPAEPRESASSKNSLFTIRDPDFEADDDKASPTPDDSGLETQAERDLANAMRRRKMLGDS
jgi:hypothetical protein